MGKGLQPGLGPGRPHTAALAALILDTGQDWGHHCIPVIRVSQHVLILSDKDRRAREDLAEE